jgi:hypothetical protein
MTLRSLLSILAAASVAASLTTAATAQQITVRDTIEALPPISFCMDGATHVTVCTRHRLRPGAVGPLAQYEGLPLELTGTPGAITCQFVTLSALTVVANEQVSVTTTTPTTMTVDFFGAGPAGDLYLLFMGVGLSPTPLTFPQFTGPVHLNTNVSWFVGIYPALGPTTPYLSIAFANNPALVGVPFYDQALVMHATGQIETSVVDRFGF